MTTATATNIVSFKVPTLSLTQLVSKVSRQLPKLTTNEMLKGIHMRFEEDHITATVYNGFLALRSTKELETPIQISRPFEVVLMHPKLATVFNQLSGAFTTIKFDPTHKTINLSSGKSKYKLSALDGLEYPNVTDIIERVPRVGTLTAEFIRTAYAQVPKFASKEETRPVLRAVKHDIDSEGSIQLTATNSYTLRTKRVPFLSDIEEAKQVLVPSEVLTELSFLLNKVEEEKVYLHASDKGVAFKWEDQEKSLSYVLYSALQEGNYPDTSRLSDVPASAPKVTILRSVFEQAIKRVLVGMTVEGGASNIHFAVKGRQARVFTRGQFPALEDFTTETSYPEEIIYTLSPQYILNGLQSFTSEELTLTLNTNITPIFIEDAQGQEGVALTLPVRTTESLKVEWPEVEEPLNLNATSEEAIVAPAGEPDEVKCFVSTTAQEGSYYVTYQSTEEDEEPWGGYTIANTQEALKELNDQMIASENIFISDVLYD